MKVKFTDPYPDEEGVYLVIENNGDRCFIIPIETTLFIPPVTLAYFEDLTIIEN